MTATSATTVPTGAKDAFLRFALRLDAAFSGLVGVAGLAVVPWLAEVSGTTTTAEYSLGAFLIAYGVVVFGLSMMRDVRILGVAATIGNVVFAVASVVVVLEGVWPLTTMGVVLTLGGGVYTLVMADLQYLGLRKL